MRLQPLFLVLLSPGAAHTCSVVLDSAPSTTASLPQQLHLHITSHPHHLTCGSGHLFECWTVQRFFEKSSTCDTHNSYFNSLGLNALQNAKNRQLPGGFCSFRTWASCANSHPALIIQLTQMQDDARPKCKPALSLTVHTPHGDYPYTFADSSHNPWRLNAKPEKPFLHKSEQRRGHRRCPAPCTPQQGGSGNPGQQEPATRCPKGQEAWEHTAVAEERLELREVKVSKLATASRQESWGANNPVRWIETLRATKK